MNTVFAIYRVVVNALSLRGIRVMFSRAYKFDGEIIKRKTRTLPATVSLNRFAGVLVNWNLIRAPRENSYRT